MPTEGRRLNDCHVPVYIPPIAGLTAAIVALPLALAFGVASGLGPLAGLYGSIFCGFFAALLGGTPSQITGPTGPMTVVTAGIVVSGTDGSNQSATMFVK